MRTKISEDSASDRIAGSSLDELQQQHVADRSRSRARLHISTKDVDRMVAEFASSHGGFTRCPPAYAVLSRQYHI